MLPGSKITRRKQKKAKEEDDELTWPSSRKNSTLRGFHSINLKKKKGKNIISGQMKCSKIAQRNTEKWGDY